MLSLPSLDERLRRFDEASNHPYECRCELCIEWWSFVPPEDACVASRIYDADGDE